MPGGLSMKDLMAMLNVEELAEVDALMKATRVLWTPDPDNKPQCMAYMSEADITGFGGAAGGGKTDLACGLATTQHRKAIIFRKSSTELPGIIDRLEELFGSRDNYNAQRKTWRFTRFDGVEVQIELGSFHDPGEEKGYQGRPHDLLVFDEASNMRESAVRFLMGWLRSVTPGQRKRALFTFNPPTDAEGRWIVQFFAPWLDDTYPNPAQPGELRWFVVVDSKDVEVPSNAPCVIVEKPNGTKELLFKFNPKDYAPDQIVTPLSRTFIPSRVGDNKFLRDTGYVATLQGLPEPLRSQMLRGDFKAGMADDAFQVIPTKWIEAAMARWTPRVEKGEMTSVGGDIALGIAGQGRDDTVIARCHGHWFDVPVIYPSIVCTDGPTVAGYFVASVRDRAPIHIDVFGVGAQPYGHLMKSHQHVLGVNMGDITAETDETGTLRFSNVRSMLWWRMREALDPAAPVKLALPPDRRLLAELCTPTWKPVGGKVQVMSREDIVKKIGRSPDVATAYILANMRTPKLTIDNQLVPSVGAEKRTAKDYSPIAAPARAVPNAAANYDPTRRRPDR